MNETKTSKITYRQDNNIQKLHNSPSDKIKGNVHDDIHMKGKLSVGWRDCLDE